MLFDDYDGDGNKDLLVCGNNNDPDVATGNYDAMAALLMKGDGKGKFVPVSASNSGLNVRGEVRKLIPLNDKTGRLVILLKNSGAAQVVSVKR